MARTFDNCRKNTMLMLTGTFNNDDNIIGYDQLIARVTLVEVHGNKLRITYKVDSSRANFCHTIIVNKNDCIKRVMIPTRKWSNWRYNHIKWLIKEGCIREGTLPDKSGREYVANWDNKQYDYEVEILY